MKMKFRYLVNSAMLWTALALGSCADFLDREPYSEPVDESYWNSEEDVEAAVAGGYGLLRAALANHSAYYAYGDIAGTNVFSKFEYEDEEWNQIVSLLPPENSGKQGRPSKCNRTILNGIVWIARSGAPWRDLPERYGAWQTVYSRFRKWIEDGILDNIFRVLSLEAELTELSIDASIVQAHQHSAGAKKGGHQTKLDTAVVEPAQKSMQL